VLVYNKPPLGNTKLCALFSRPREHRQRMRLGIQHPLIERDGIVIPEEKKPVLQRLRQEKAARTIKIASSSARGARTLACRLAVADSVCLRT
jgi:hypothetical protein